MSIFYINPFNIYDEDAAAYINAVESADGQTLETGVRDAINKFFVGCKSDGIFDAIKASCILAGARTLAGALVPLVSTMPSPTNYNFGSGDYNRETGLVGDGSTKRLVSNRAGNADPQNNRHISTYIGATSAKTDFSLLMCDALNGVEVVTQIGISPDLGLIATRASTTSGDVSNLYNGVGFYGVSRIASGSYTARGNTTSTTITRASQTPPPDSYGIFMRSKDASTSPAQFYDGRLAFYSIGESLDLALLDARVSTLMSDLYEAIKLWTPAEMSTILWLDANDTSTVLRDNPGVDDQVYQWNDKSGNNNHATQSNDALKPTWNSTGYVQFTGNFSGGDIMQVTNDPFRDLQNPAVIAVARYYDPNGQTWSNALATYDGEGLGWQLRQFSTIVDKIVLSIRGTAADDDFLPDGPTSINTLSDFIIAGYRKNSDTRVMRGNGTQTAILNNDTGTIPYYTATNRSGIGGRFRSDNWGSIQGNLNGHIREIIVADGLSDSNIEKIEGYLAYKWGLSGNLPAGHPYKSEPPYVQ